MKITPEQAWAGPEIEFVSTPKAIAMYSMDKNFMFVYEVSFYPNAFHRFFQRVILGIYWRKL